jgi:hypothetical protein
MSANEREKKPEQSRSLAPEKEGEEGGLTMKPPVFQLQAGPQNETVTAAATTRDPALEVAEYIAAEMNTNAASQKAAQIRANWNSWNPLDKVQALMDWKDMVDYNSPWDHKPYIQSIWGTYQSDNAGNVDWFFDIWSNMHYGYVGKACGFGLDLLLNAAGIAQWLSSQVPDGYWSRRLETFGDADVFRALDDPSDQLASRLGYNMGSVSAASVLSVMRANVAGLNHRALTQGA